MRTAVDSLTAGGNTPTPSALASAAADLQPFTGPRLLVLVSDGQSTCGDPCPVAEQIKAQQGIEFTTVAIGFQTSGQANNELQCIADATGGIFLLADDAEGLRNAITAAVETPTDPGDDGDGDGEPPVVEEPPTPTVGPVIYLSSTSSGTVGGVTFQDEDIVSYNTSTEEWQMVFDGSDFRLGGGDVDGFHVERIGLGGVIHLSFLNPLIVPGLGFIDDSDIVTFRGQTGPESSGTFELLFDGSAVEVRNGGEDIDALFVSEENVFLSTLSNLNVSGLSAKDEDLTMFSSTSTGTTTSGTFEPWFDGSDVLFSFEDVSGASLTSDGNLYLSSSNNYNVEGGTLRGDRDDILRFVPTSLGSDTSGTFERVFDGDEVGYNEIIDGLHVMEG